MDLKANSATMGKVEAFGTEPLDKEETSELWREAQSADFQGPAFDKLVEHNMGLAPHFATKFAASAPHFAGVEVDELEGIALLTIVQQIPRFDPAIGQSLSSWLSLKLRGTLYNAVLKSIKVSAGPAPTARGRGLGMVAVSQGRADMVAPTDEFDQRQDRADIERLVALAGDRLTDRELEAIDHYLEDLTYLEVGERLGGVTKQRAEQLVTSAVTKLREFSC